MLETFLRKLAKGLDDQRVPYLIIGGQAALIHGRPRLTQDVDVTLGVDTDSLAVILALCRRLTLRPLPKNPRRFVEESRVLPAQDRRSGLRVDLIFSNTPYERQAMARASVVRMAGYPVRFASAEDLILHKLFAGRAIDLEDAKAVILRQGRRLNTAYIRRWLRAFGDVVEDGRDLLAVWRRLVRDTR